MEEQKAQEKDLVVDVSAQEVKIALMENHRLIEYNHESNQGRSFSVGDVYLGRVKKILPSLNAAFVDIGDSKEAFIHYLPTRISAASSPASSWVNPSRRKAAWRTT